MSRDIFFDFKKGAAFQELIRICQTEFILCWVNSSPHMDNSGSSGLKKRGSKTKRQQRSKVSSHYIDTYRGAYTDPLWKLEKMKNSSKLFARSFLFPVVPELATFHFLIHLLGVTTSSSETISLCSSGTKKETFDLG